MTGRGRKSTDQPETGEGCFIALWFAGLKWRGGRYGGKQGLGEIGSWQIGFGYLESRVTGVYFDADADRDADCSSFVHLWRYF